MHIPHPALSTSRRLPFGVSVILFAVILLAGCEPHTEGAINVTRTSARLVATGSCGSGDTVCSYFFRYRLQGGSWAKTPTRKIGVVSNHTVTEEITNLIPHITYEYQICGIGNNKNNTAWVCRGDENNDEVSRFVTGIFGIDSNQVAGHPGASDGTNFSIDKATSAGVHWVARYIDPKNTPITLAEVVRWHNQAIKVAFIWEIDKYRPCSANNADDEFRRGKDDGTAAREYMNSSLGAPRDAAVYFTVDFHISQTAWDGNQVVPPREGEDGSCNQTLGTRHLVERYFDGLKSTFAPGRIGVYGSYATVKGLLDDLKAAYAWQQAFLGGPIDKRAILLQYDIFPQQDGWLVTQGAGALDLDVSVAGFTSMW